MVRHVGLEVKGAANLKRLVSYRAADVLDFDSGFGARAGCEVQGLWRI